MTRTAAALGVLALAFATAEFVRPTHVPPKKFAARALLIAPQAGAFGTADSIDPALLEDLPRIHPDAAGTLRVTSRKEGDVVVSGTLAEPETGKAGAAAFLIVDGRRSGRAATTYGREPAPTAYAIRLPSHALGGGPHRLQVGLVSTDLSGFFLLPIEARVRKAR